MTYSSPYLNYSVLCTLFLLYVKMESALNRRKNLLNDCVSSLRSCMELINRYSSEEDKIQQRQQVKKIVRDYCEIEFELEQAQTACNSSMEHFDGEDDCTEDVLEVYNRYLNNAVHQVIPYTEHPIWKFISSSFSNTESKISGEASTSANTSLVLSQSFQVPIDPLTKKSIQNPCKSRVCGHVYEYETILSYVKLREAKTCWCPYVGCTSIVKISDLYEDEILKNSILKTVDCVSEHD